ncbi:MAG: hypothetical protein R2734_04195 [Nocardioides sp.]
MSVAAIAAVVALAGAAGLACPEVTRVCAPAPRETQAEARRTRADATVDRIAWASAAGVAGIVYLPGHWGLLGGCSWPLPPGGRGRGWSRPPSAGVGSGPPPSCRTWCCCSRRCCDGVPRPAWHSTRSARRFRVAPRTG